MFETSTHTTSPQGQSLRGTLRARSVAFAAAVAALAVAITGFTAPAALAAEAGDYLQTGRLGDEGQFDHPHGIAVDGADNVYVTDGLNHRIQKFNASGELLQLWGSQGSGVMEFEGPTAVAVRGDGPLYVVDNGNNRIRKFSPTGQTLGGWGKFGTGDGEFKQPYAAAVDSAGYVYVTDTVNHRVQKFNGNGEYQTQWGNGPGAGQDNFNGPLGIAIDSQDNVYVADLYNHRIKKYSSSGVYLNEWKQGAGWAPLDRPFGISIDAADNVYVVEQTSKTVQKFTKDGVFLSTWGKQQGGEWYFTYPNQVAVDSRGQGYVTDSDRVHAFRQAVPAVFTTGLSPSGVVGKGYSSQLTATGFPAVSGFQIVTGQLPPGLKLLGNTVSGVPTTVGTYKVTLRAENWLTPFSEKTYTITVTAPPVVSAAKVASKLSVKLSTKYPKVRRTNIKATIRLYAPSSISKTGKIRMYYGKKRIKTYTMRSYNKGVIRVTMPKFTKRGKTKVTFRYLGNTRLKASSRSVYVRVR